MTDAWEAANRLDAGNRTDAASDRDGDGLSALAEFRFGTDPSDTDTDDDGIRDDRERILASLPSILLMLD